ncbi:hypothetical protein [Hydromonas duriensis]|uniref:Uncharacterized protein n=1 Tax=Hydromonas duriensis TaxID=1527608 RepID=A0A4R6Y334_9BURK|nr:hypothetical protein [Hydromonas duriensis]TDR30764.1 hypothetical protein DFR44_11743 [Hydromonas duriensis]
MLFHVYNEEKPAGFFIHEPDGLYRAILDADWILYLLLPLLLLVAIFALMYLWRLHEIPKHKAEHKKMIQAELVSALTILGLFEHWVWAVALFIAYTNWNSVEEFFVNVLRRSREIEPIAAQENAASNAPQSPQTASPEGEAS